MVASVTGTTASAFPAFLTGAIAVQLTAGLDMGDAELGLAIGAYFSGAALASSTLGRAAERLGPSTAMRLGMGITATTGLLLGTVVASPVALGVLLLLAGTSNALTQPAANLLITERLPAGRHGIAFALKQSGMPMATLLGGLAVPFLAIAFGWQSAYLAGAVLAGGALLAIPPSTAATHRRSVVRRRRAAAPAPPRGPRPRPDLPMRLLWLYGLAGLLGAATAGATVSFLVSGAVDSGIGPAAAGLLLTGGSVIGVASRLLHGRWADKPGRLPIRRVVLLLALGAVGLLVLALHVPVAYVVGVVPMFAFGWAWPGLFNLSVVRNNPSAPAAATGITQTGIYIGAGGGPVLGGMVAATAGYPALWLLGAASLAAASVVSLWLRVLMLRRARVAAAAPVTTG
jgi:MFS family permease